MVDKAGPPTGYKVYLKQLKEYSNKAAKGVQYGVSKAYSNFQNSNSRQNLKSKFNDKFDSLTMC